MEIRMAGKRKPPGKAEGRAKAYPANKDGSVFVPICSRPMANAQYANLHQMSCKFACRPYSSRHRRTPVSGGTGRADAQRTDRNLGTDPTALCRCTEDPSEPDLTVGGWADAQSLRPRALRSSVQHARRGTSWYIAGCAAG